MKKLEDIERMSFEELEKVSLDGGVSSPEGFGERLEGAVAGLAAAGEGMKTKGVRLRTAAYSLAGAAMAAVLMLLVLGRPGTPADSFDDPLLAYAEVQKSFSLISEKMSKTTELVLEASSEMNKPKEIIDKITK